MIILVEVYCYDVIRSYCVSHYTFSVNLTVLDVMLYFLKYVLHYVHLEAQVSRQGLPLTTPIPGSSAGMGACPLLPHPLLGWINLTAAPLPQLASYPTPDMYKTQFQILIAS